MESPTKKFRVEHYKSGQGSVSQRLFGGLLASTVALSFFVGPIHLIVSILLIMGNSPYGVYSAALLLAFIVLPPVTSRRITSSWPVMCIHHYFDFELISCLDTTADDGRRYIYAITPHGVVSYGGLCWGAYLSKFTSDPLPFTGVATAIMSLGPYVKHLIGLFPLTDASWASLRSVLRTSSATLYPGGIAEMYLSSSQEERLFLRTRKGFIKLAMQSGTDVVPVYMFGNSSAMCVWKAPYLQWLSRKYRMSLTLIWGRCYLPIPMPIKIVTCVGPSLGLPCIDNPTKEQVDFWHKKYLEAVTELFDTYKGLAPEYANKALTILRNSRVRKVTQCIKANRKDTKAEILAVDKMTRTAFITTEVEHGHKVTADRVRALSAQHAQ